MLFRGIKKSSLIDWPGKIVATLFTGGCSFRCGWCQNPDLVLNRVTDEIPIHDVIEYLETNRKWIDGICVSGGEPLICGCLPDMLEQFKTRGFPVKLDTNGYHPEELNKIIENKWVDYIAMDLKYPLSDRYSEAAGVEVDLERIKKSIKAIMESGIDCEFRTTVVPGLISEQEVEAIAGAVSGAKRYALQNFRPAVTLDEKYSKIKAYSINRLKSMAECAAKYVQKVDIR